MWSKCNRIALAVALASLLLGACFDQGSRGKSSDDGGTHEHVGTLSLALASEARVADVAGVEYSVVAGDGQCGDSPIAARSVELLVSDSNDNVPEPGQVMADTLFVLPAGSYRVCVVPVKADGSPSLACEPVSAVATVVAKKTTEVVLVSRCEHTDDGGLDAVVSFEQGPAISDVTLSSGKYISDCGETVIKVSVDAAQPDQLSYEWSVQSDPPDAQPFLHGDGNQVTFNGTAGTYQITVRVKDAAGLAAELTFPVYVSEDGCVPPPPEAHVATHQTRVRLAVSHLSSNFGADGDHDALALTLSRLHLPEVGQTAEENEKALSAVKAALLSSLSLERADGSLVQGQAREGLFNMKGTQLPGSLEPAFSFVPAASLVQGWYTLRADLGAAIQAGLVGPELIGERLGKNGLLASFYLGSRAMYTRLRLQCSQPLRDAPVPAGASGGRSCFLSLVLSEPIRHLQLAAAAAGVAVSYGATSVTCLPVSQLHRRNETEVSLLCREPPLGTSISVAIGSLPSPLGTQPSTVHLTFDRPTLVNRGTSDSPIWFAEIPAEE